MNVIITVVGKNNFLWNINHNCILYILVKLALRKG